MTTASEIADRLGLRKYPRSWRGQCPRCSYPTTFAVRAGNRGRALFFCASCQDPAALADAVARAIGHPHSPERLEPHEDAAAARQQKQEKALGLWRGSEPAAGTPADLYLIRRGLPGLASSSALRFRADTPHPEAGRYPALIALVSDVDGRPIAVHRTFLTRDGHKASAEPVKASLGPIWGGAIRLQSIGPDKALVIGEGIETAGSAGLLIGLPAWSAISAGNLAKGLVLPPEAEHVIIAADADKPGREAARDAWTRWTSEGREVQVAMPDGDGDFNDLLLARRTANAR